MRRVDDLEATGRHGELDREAVGRLDGRPDERRADRREDVDDCALDIEGR